MVFFGFVFFVGFNVKRFVFGVSGIVSKVLKMLVFSQFFGGFSGVAHGCSSGFGRFRCFCVSCVCFCFFLLLLFLFCLLCFWPCGWMLLFCFFWVFFLFFFVVLFFVCFVFFGGFKGQVRWPEGPPHLALNPPYFICFVFFFCFFLFFFVSLLFFCLFFWRV